MGISDKLKEFSEPGKSGSDVKALNTPEDWRPRLDVDETKGGFVVSTPRPAGQLPDAKEVLEEFGLDPNAWSVTSLRRSRWQTYSGEWLESVRVSLAPLGVTAETQLDAEKLIDEIKKWRPAAGIKQATGKGVGK